MRHVYVGAVPRASRRAFLGAFPAESARRKVMYSLRDGATAAASARRLRPPGWTRPRRADQAQKGPGATGLSRLPPGPIPSTGQARHVIEALELAQLDVSTREAARADVSITPMFGPSTWRHMQRAGFFLSAAVRRPRPRSSASRWSLVRTPREVAWFSTPRTPQYSAPDHRGRRIPPNPLLPHLATVRVHRGVLEQKLQLDHTLADVTRQSIARAPEHGQHGRVVGQDVRREAANAVGCRILDGPSLEGAAEADALPFGIDHVGHVGQPGPRIEEIGATADDALGFGLADDGDECHLLLVADSAEMLCHLVGQRAELTEEAGPHVLGSEVEEQTLEGGRIAGPGRPDGHLAAVAQLRLSYLLDRIGSMTAQCLASR